MSLNTQEFLKPTLKQWKETKSYDITKFFFVSYFGGVIPIIILGTRNAKWLNIDKKLINIFILIGIIILLSYVSISTYVDINGMPNTYGNTLRIGYRLACLLFYGCYYLAMETNFKKHMTLSGEILPTMKVSFIWTFIGAAINILLLMGGIYIGELLA